MLHIKYDIVGSFLRTAPIKEARPNTTPGSSPCRSCAGWRTPRSQSWWKKR